MDKEQRIAEIREELHHLANAREKGYKANVWNLLKMLGVDERIINNPNPNELGMDPDFDNFLQGLGNANITIDDNGSISLKTNNGSTFIFHESKNVSGIEIELTVKDGGLHMGAAFKRGSFRAYKDQFDMIVVPYGNDYAVRTRTSEYCLESEYSQEKRKYETRGGGLCTISDYNKDGIELTSSKVIYGNEPNIMVNGYNGLDLNTVWRQEEFARDSAYGHKNLKDINPYVPCADKNSVCSYGEYSASRMESIDKVQVARWNAEELKWDYQYHLALTGEYDMSRLFNNSESYSSIEELDSVRKQRLEEGWYDRKIENYKQVGGTTANSIAYQLEQAKLKLEETQGRGL